MSRGLDRYSLQFVFSYLVPTITRVSFGNAFGKRWTYTCRFGPPLRVIQNDRGRALRQFVNAGESEREITRFTEKYGPVRYEHSLPGLKRTVHATTEITSEFPELLVKAPVADESGEFCLVSVWRENQRVFRQLWSRAKNLPSVTLEEAWGGQLAVSGDVLTYTTRSLHAFLYLSILANRDRLRICAFEQCPAPYYFKRHAPDRYCSPECAYEAKIASKRKWWHENRSSKSRLNARK